MSGNELIALVLWFGVMIFVLGNYQKLRRFPRWGVIFLSFLLYGLAELFTNLEGLAYYHLFNLLEHICYALSAVLMVGWCFLIFRTERIEE